jgi:hypothetical protein
MERIKEIWNQLEADKTDSTGLFKTRYTFNSVCELYLGLLTPSNTRCLLLRFPIRAFRNLQIDKKMKGLRFEITEDAQNKSFVFLNLILINKSDAEIFDVLLSDIISSITALTDEQSILKGFLNRVETWRNLFDKLDAAGLSAESQMGLFGELYFLKKWLLLSDDKKNCIKSWGGPDNTIRDFQNKTWGLEVKTTQTNNHQKLQISSERQLDTTTLENLILYHLSVEKQPSNGFFLNKVVNEIIEILSSDSETKSLFIEKLMQVGYLMDQQLLYTAFGYHIRQENYYQVNNEFPRIEEKDIRRGVGDVKYSIILSEYTDYLIEESVALQIIN